ncbi:MAG TPA: two-component regulator propeller domain-containing protein [Candidatus Solibacter sp.]|nr:two-component regulator propeller domain-containing protein [Candidatus Solibacter sp.]
MNRIVRDARGYLWFCTSEGLSRFDGYEFHNYGRRDGLPHRVVNDVLETRSGELWVATSGGLCQYLPRASGNRRFRIYRVEKDDRASHVNVLLEDTGGRLWCGTDAGLFRLERRHGRAEPVLTSIDLGTPKEAWDDQIVSALLQDARGNLWVGAGSGLYRQGIEGGIERYTEKDGLPQNFVTALLQDPQRRIWVGTHGGLCKLVVEPSPGRKAMESIFQEKEGLVSDAVQVVRQLNDGTLCVGTKVGLSVMHAGGSADSPAFSTYTRVHGLPATGVEALAEDTAGNLWIGTDGSGAAKLVWNTFLTYTTDDGLGGAQIDFMFEDATGKLCVVTRQGSTDLYINEFDGHRFRATRVNLPTGTRLLNWGARAQSMAHDEEGNWWIGTSDGLFRYAGVSRISDLARKLPAAHYTEHDGLPPGPVVSVFEDSAGSLWLSTTGKRNGLAQRNRHDQGFRRHSEGLPWLLTSGVSLFAEDGSRRLWMGLLRFGRGQAEIARLHESAIERIGGGDDAPSGGIRTLYVDRQKRLWVGTNQNGLMRFDHPESDQPTFRRYTTADGLSSDVTLSLTEDRSDRIYVGNGSGVDSLEVRTGQIKRYTSADGLAPGEVQASFRDHNGVLWFGTAAGLSRLVALPAHVPASPPVAITSVRVGGVRLPGLELGEYGISGLRYPPNQNDVEVGFAGPAFAPGDTLRYQYMLEGADSEWGPPSPQRSVNYANLPPGSYRFLVRATNSEGAVSERPAFVEFVILPPVWRRWWFQLLAAAMAAAAIYRLHHYRVTRLLELERIRTRIATDLHDDIGSSLSQIAILSEVANRHVDPANPGLGEPLTDIADISRELVDSMSDIVWAIDPERDHLGDLVHRMRRFASDVLSPQDIHLVFQSPAEPQELQMGADLRRQIFLIFKEAVHNTLRHSGATEIRIDFQLERGWLNLTVADNGAGFDVARDHEGHGLRSMRERAHSLGGGLEIISSPRGTGVVLRVPSGRRGRSTYGPRTSERGIEKGP